MSRGWVRRLVGDCLQHPATAVVALGAPILVVGLEAVSPLVIRRVVDDAAAGSTHQLWWLLGVLVALAAIRFGGSFTIRYAADRLGLGVEHTLRGAIFAAVQRFDGGQQDSMRAGQVVSRAISDLQRVQGLVSVAPMVLGTLSLTFVAFAAMLTMSVPLTVLAAITVPLVAVVTAWTGKQLFPVSRDAQQHAADMVQHVEETITGVRVVKGFGQEERETARYAQKADELVEKRMRLARVTARPSALLAVLPGLGQAGLLGLGGWLALQGSLTVGELLAFFTYIALLTGPVTALSTMVMTGQLNKASVQRVYELIDSQPEVVEAPDATDLSDGPLNLQLNGVQFGYTRDEPVLNGFDLDVQAGETVALVGTSGSGKSTVSLLLSRFYDVHAGSISIGDKDVREVRTQSLRTAVGVVFEEAFLFSDTIRANIAYGAPDATDAEVEQAARQAQAHGFITALPQGYDTVVGERGHTLSGGQRQRIALARALLKNPRVLVLDDATSAIDSRTEAAIHDTLKNVVRSRTTLLVAHRRSTLKLADRIAVVDKGKVVDIGTQAELTTRCPLFTKLLSGDELDAPEETNELWPQPLEPEKPVTPTKNEEDEPVGLRNLLRPVKHKLAGALALMAVHAGAVLAVPALVSAGVDDGVKANAPNALWAVTGIALLVVLTDGVVTAAQGMLTSAAGEKVLRTVRVRSFAKLQKLGLDFYERQQAGQLLTRMTTDVDALATFASSGLTGMLANLLTMTGIAIALLLNDLKLGLVALAAVPLLAGVTALFSRRTAKAYDRARELVGEVNADLQENVSGLRVAQAYAAQPSATKRFDRRSDDYRRARLRARRYLATQVPLVTLLGDIAAAVVLGVGAQAVATSAMTAGVLMAFLLYVARLYSPIQQLAASYDSYQQARAGLRRITELMDMPVSVATPRKPRPIPRLRGEIELVDVDFRYPGAKEPVLKNISLHVRAGETVALVGETGAGKSTLVKLIARLYDPTEGVVCIDGVNLCELDPSELRRRLGVVPQEPHLFNGDIAANIRYPRPESNQAEIEDAARRTGALPMIASLRDGFRHPVGERGQGLSAGQRQLIALARAELANPDVLLFDEATASLDVATEAAVLAAGRRLVRRRTTVLVAHRLTTAASADRIVVLDNGRIAEIGSHEELLARGGAYARMWSLGSTGAA